MLWKYEKYRGITGLLQWYSGGGKGVLQGCYRGVTWLLQGRHMGVKGCAVFGDLCGSIRGDLG